MNIEKIILSNFKCHKDLSHTLKKITLLTGANSSGKSSIIYSILSILQSKSFPRDWELNGEFISLGDFEEIIHRHNTKETISIGIETNHLGQKTSLTAKFKYNEQTRLAKLVKAKVESKSFGGDFDYSNDGILAKITYDPAADPSTKVFDNTFKKMLLTFSEIVETSATDQTRNSKLEKRSTTLKNALENTTSTRNLDIKAQSLKELDEKLSDDFFVYHRINQIRETSEKLRECVSYIGPFRYSPERTYYRASRKDLRVGTCGENYIEQLLHWSEFDKEKFEEVITTLENMGLASLVRFKKYPGGRYEVRIRTKTGGALSNMVDIGLGVSQFLPILVANLQLEKGGTAVVAQPEIHLHPSAQAAYGTFIAERAAKGENRYIIETHSEYIINRLRLLVAQGAINQEDIKIIHISGGRAAKTHEISMTKTGKLLGAPKDFFETYQMDVIDLAISSANS